MTDVPSPQLVRLVLLVIITASGCGRGGEQPPIFTPHHPALKKLSNGMELMLIEDHEFPTAQLQFFIRGGTVYDPPGKEGLASIAMQAIRLGGAIGRTPDQIEEDLEFVGASLEMGTSSEFESVSLSLLAKDLDQGIDILFDLLRRPAFDSSRFQIVKARAKDSLLRDREEPFRLGSKEFGRFVYGEASPWGRQPTPESIDRIDMEDVRRFYDNSIFPDRILVAASGDFAEAEFVAKIESRTREWSQAGWNPPVLSPVSEKFEKGAEIVPRKALTQATILVGHLGAKRTNPDKFPLLVMNFILGGSGSLTSRLGEEIRSSSGKAYSVWSDFGFGKDYGLFRAVAQTSIENTEWVVKKMAEMIRAAVEKTDFSKEEVDAAKRAMLRSLVFDFETRFSQVKEQARFHLWGYPEDYLVLFQKKIAAISKKDVERVARQYLHPDGLKVLVVTDEKELEKMRAALAPWAVGGNVAVRRFE